MHLIITWILLILLLEKEGEPRDTRGVILGENILLAPCLIALITLCWPGIKALLGREIISGIRVEQDKC